MPAYGVGQGEATVNSLVKRTVDNSASYMKTTIQPHMSILDVGCGPGSITLGFAKLVPQGHATGLDTELASQTLDRARAQAKKEGITNVDFIVGDALALPFPDATFDITHAHQVLMHSINPVQIIREMRRVTKPGGFVACRELDGPSLFTQPELEPMTAFYKLIGRLSTERGFEGSAGRYLPAWARRAGFDRLSIRYSTSTWTYAMLEERQVWGGVLVGIAEDSSYRDAAVQKGYTTEAELDQMAQACKDWVADENAFLIGGQ